MIMPDLDWFPTDPYRLFNLIKYDQNGYFFGWGEWMGVVGGGFWNLPLQSFTIFYIQIEPYRMVLIFSLKTTNKSTKWFVVFFLNVNPEFTSRFGFTEWFGVFLGKFSQMGLCAEQLYKMFFSEKMKTHDLFKGTLLNGL
jgi:hypothetical protein